MNKIYRGNRNSFNVVTKRNELLVTYAIDGAEPHVLKPELSQRFFNHSPTGFEWGYAGSGPAQLALAILLDVTRDAKLSITYHQDFKREFVAIWGDKWEITSDQVRAWLAEQVYGKAKLSFDDTRQLYMTAVLSHLYPYEALDHLADQLHELERQRRIDRGEAETHAKEIEP